MRILDLDLDFFLNKIAFWKKGNKRLDDKNYIPWKENKLINFLENQCKLSTDNKINGKIVKKHNEAYYFWKYLIKNNNLNIPFEIVHIDAHGDLGMGDNSYEYLQNNYLKLPIKERYNILDNEELNKQINEGNYLAFTIANRWINKLTYVIHPLGGNDVPLEYLKIINSKQYIQLNNNEPLVNFKKINGKNYFEEKPFDYIVLAQSPKYTPKGADKLIKIFRKYIDEI